VSEDLPAYAEVGVAHMRGLRSLRETESHFPKLFRSHNFLSKRSFSAADYPIIPTFNQSSLFLAL
jgi:hypothetical protein